MKRVMITTLAALMMLSLMPIGVAGATGGSKTKAKNTITIERDAQYDVVGSIVHVGLNVKCEKSPLGIPGQVEVDLTQSPPETPEPVAVSFGVDNVVCDGKTHLVGVTTQGLGLDAGRAQATATLYPAVDSGSALDTVTTSRTVTIVVTG